MRNEAAEPQESFQNPDFQDGWLAAHNAILAALRAGFEHLFNEQTDLLDEDLAEEDRERIQKEDEELEQMLEDENIIKGIERKEEDNAS